MQQNRQLLHVDDDPVITRVVARRLAAAGYEVAVENDATRAFDTIVGSRHRLVILDIDMPDVNGLQLLDQIKTFDGGIQVIMLTGLVSLNSVLSSLRLGAEACLFKPLDDVEPLLDAVGAAFTKLDHWWESLHRLSRLRRQSPASLAGVGT